MLAKKKVAELFHSVPTAPNTFCPTSKGTNSRSLLVVCVWLCGRFILPFYKGIYFQTEHTKELKTTLESSKL